MIHRTRFHFCGSVCQLAFDSSSGDAEEYTGLVARELNRLDSKFSSYQAESLVSAINQAAGTGHFVALDAEARGLFDYASALWQQSSHIFDPTTRLLQNCYSDDGQLRATKSQINNILQLVGWSKLELDEAGAHLSEKGMLIDLNSCVHPYALDSIRKILLRNGVEHALIEMDHDAVSIGKQSDGANWLRGLRHPMGNRSAINRIKFNHKGFAMRGEFERRIIFNGERFGRALNPIDGYPVPGMLSVSVLADSCLAACGAATVARLKTEQAAINWLENLDLPWVAVDRNLHCHGPLAPNRHPIHEPLN